MKTNNYYSWTVSQGDYFRSYESTLTFARKLSIRKHIKKIAHILFFMGASAYLFNMLLSHLH